MRALLEVDVAAAIDHKHMHRTVQQTTRVDFTSGELARDFIALVDHVEELAGFLTCIGAGALLIPAGEIHPLKHGELFRAQGDRHLQMFGQGLPAAIGSFRQEFFHLLATLAEPHAHEFFKHLAIADGQAGRITRHEAHDATVHPWPWLKGFWRNDAQHLHIPVTLNEHGEAPIAVLADFGREAIADFFLQHEHGASHRGGRCEHVLQNLTSDRIGQISHDSDIAVVIPLARVHLGGIAVHHLDARLTRKALLELGSEVVVLFNEQQLLWATDEMFGHGTEPRAGFDDKGGTVWLDLIRDPQGDGFINEEVLTQAFARSDFLAADDACAFVSWADGFHASDMAWQAGVARGKTCGEECRGGLTPWLRLARKTSLMKITRYTNPTWPETAAALNRRAEASDAVQTVVAEVIKAVRERGDAALVDLTLRFDGAQLTPQTLRLPAETLDAAWDSASTELKSALEASHRNVFDFAQKSLRQNWSGKNEQGAEVGEVYHPFERVGCYVPGGSAPLVSTALMTVTLAAAAGVPEIVVCTPCGRDGTVNPGLLAALKLAGATEVYQIGGAQAIAAMAYGTESIQPVAKIFGPGNSYVVEAKRQAFGVVSIDLLPGPSEVLILADRSGNPAFIAADILAQAEHGKDSQAGFITDDAALLEAVVVEVERQCQSLSRQAQLRPVLEKGVFLLLAPTLEEGARLVNAYAPEHLSLITEREAEILPLIRTAGAIFIGNHSPVAVGDFLAGPSHTLPTGGAGKSFPGLTVDMFQRRTSIIRLDAESCARSEPVVRAFAAVEGLDAHGESVAIRSRGN